MTIRTLDILRDEHQALAAMLRSLSMMLAHARRHAALPDFDVLRAMLFYIDEFPERRHHPKESQLLFPLLRARAPALAPVLDRLDTEHARGEQAIRELEHALLAFEVMGPARRENFETAVRRYIDFYLGHMALEEEAVLPVAQQVLAPADWAVLDDAFAADADPLSGHLAGRAAAHPGNEVYRDLFQRIAMAAPAPIGLG